MRYRWNPKVACQTLDDTSFILLNDIMLSLNETGSHVWDCCREGATVDDVASSVSDTFEVTQEVAQADARAFVEMLASRGLLVEMGES